MGHKFDARILIDHLKAKWSNRCCPMCQTESWSVSDMIYELRKFSDGHLIIGGGPVVPIVPVICEECGHTLLIHAYSTHILRQQ